MNKLARVLEQLRGINAILISVARIIDRTTFARHAAATYGSHRFLSVPFHSIYQRRASGYPFHSIPSIGGARVALQASCMHA